MFARERIINQKGGSLISILIGSLLLMIVIIAFQRFHLELTRELFASVAIMNLATEVENRLACSGTGTLEQTDPIVIVEGRYHLQTQGDELIVTEQGGQGLIVNFNI